MKPLFRFLNFFLLALLIIGILCFPVFSGFRPMQNPLTTFSGPADVKNKNRPETQRNLDAKLQQIIDHKGPLAMDPGPEFDQSKIQLGKKLFWDKILSGNKDISCGGCHPPRMGTSDGLSLSIGTKSEGEFPDREVGPDRQFIPRNAQDIFNRGSKKWRTLFRDIRVRRTSYGDFITPAGFDLPDDLNHIMAAQAMVPVTARDEMRGYRGDRDVHGELNQLARIPEGQFQEIWDALYERIIQIKKYRTMFRNAYPKQSLDKMGFKHAANAIAAYQISAFTFLNSPWDRFLQGQENALTRSQKKGAILFYGKAECSSCHAGSLMTDQEPHNIAVPQLGPGKEPDEPYDLGAYSTTGDPSDRFAFRTPPLRNVTVTGPWMHNGAYKTLESAVRHHLAPKKSLRNYDKQQLKYDLRKRRSMPIWQSELDRYPVGAPGRHLISTVKDRTEEHRLILRNLDPWAKNPPNLTKEEFENVIDFLKSLTSPSVKPVNGKINPDLKETIPDTVPSGLPVQPSLK